MIIQTYSTQKRKKRKPNAYQRQLADEWNAILKKYDTKVSVQHDIGVWEPKKPFVRQTPHFPSLNTGGGTATKPSPKVYTGTKVVGIATLHKSNAVPVFNNEEAVEISKMRR